MFPYKKSHLPGYLLASSDSLLRPQIINEDVVGPEQALFNLETPAYYLLLANSDPPIRNQFVHTLFPKDAEITDKELVGPEQVVGPESITVHNL